MNNKKISMMSPDELFGRMTNGAAPVLVDVREEHELYGNLGHIDGIVHIPMGRMPEGAKDYGRDEELVIVCRSDSRARTVAKQLMKDGFSNIKVLEGGMIAWNQDPERDAGGGTEP